MEEEQCILCLEKMINETPLNCGHVFHIDCIRKHFKPECPLCRKEHNIDVLGTKPELFLPFNSQTIGDMINLGENSLRQLYFELEIDEEPEDEEPEDEEDEENPKYDNWDYEDV